MLKYLELISKFQNWPIVCDSNHKILSLPPVINSKYSQMTKETTDILIEVTSNKNMEICKNILDKILEKSCKIFDKTTNNPLIVSQIEILSEDGHVRIKYPLLKDINEISKQLSIL